MGIIHLVPTQAVEASIILDIPAVTYCGVVKHPNKDLTKDDLPNCRKCVTLAIRVNRDMSEITEEWYHRVLLKLNLEEQREKENG